MSVADSRFNASKIVIGSSPTDLDEKVTDHENRGWKKVGKVSVSHGAYRSEYVQVMKFEGDERNARM